MPDGHVLRFTTTTMDNSYINYDLNLEGFNLAVDKRLWNNISNLESQPSPELPHDYLTRLRFKFNGTSSIAPNPITNLPLLESPTLFGGRDLSHGLEYNYSGHSRHPPFSPTVSPYVCINCNLTKLWLRTPSGLVSPTRPHRIQAGFPPTPVHQPPLPLLGTGVRKPYL